MLSQFEEHELSLPKEYVVQADPSSEANTAWQICDLEDNLKYRIVSSEDGLSVLLHKAGYIESISKSRVAMLSMLFIGVIFGFLLVLVHIAGRRWNAAGRFDKIPD